MRITADVKAIDHVYLPEDEIELTAVRAQGPGGQHVNKVSSAIHLRFNIHRSSLPIYYQHKLLKHRDQRISKTGEIVIKAQEYRTQEKNRQAARQRLLDLIHEATKKQKSRRTTKPTRAANQRRLNSKSKRGQIKHWRRKVKGF